MCDVCVWVAVPCNTFNTQKPKNTVVNVAQSKAGAKCSSGSAKYLDECVVQCLDGWNPMRDGRSLHDGASVVYSCSADGIGARGNWTPVDGGQLSCSDGSATESAESGSGKGCAQRLTPDTHTRTAGWLWLELELA
jgi:hypothetical protein